jgi:hypothetical protein
MARFELATLCLRNRCTNHYATLAILFKININNQTGGLAQLEERVVSNDEAPGSKPGFSNM